MLVEGNSRAAEAELVDALRADPQAWIAELALVGSDGRHDAIVGFVVCTRGQSASSRRWGWAHSP